MHCEEKQELGKKWKNEFSLASNGIHNQYRKQNLLWEYPRKNEWNNSLQRYVVFLSLPPANHTLSYAHSGSVSLLVEGDIHAVLASLKMRIFLVYFPKWMYQFNQLINWKLLRCEPTQALCVDNWVMQIADKLDKTAISQLWAAEGWSQCRFPAECFPKELLLHIPLTTHQALWMPYPLSFCLENNTAVIFLTND